MGNTTNRTCIALKKETHAKLSSLGKKGQTFDQIITTLLQNMEDENWPHV